ncbi:MAG TPA: radical SAM protein [Candidatus Nanoarchaeia archaeon]|nr:radical SAM protein [Candidatus Nanoarchaeia archaeon]
MAKPTPEAIWNLSDKELLTFLDSEEQCQQSRRIQFYAPSFTYYKTSNFCSSSKDFPTISITGSSCALNCKHCAGKVLETMNPADTPEKLLTLCTKLKQEGAKGVLISGGCLPDGSVPLQKFMASIAKIKNSLGLTVFVHTGIVDTETANGLKEAGVDTALIDIIGSDETIKEIYNLNTNTQNYSDSLKALDNAQIDFVPHIVTGLHHGQLKGELNALKTISNFKPSAIVIISFMPIHGTTMAKTKPPQPITIARTTATARAMFPRTPLVLGCMRPKGKHRAETDILTLKAGIDGIAFPSEEAIKYTEKHGIQVKYSSFCCAQIYKDLKTK